MSQKETEIEAPVKTEKPTWSYPSERLTPTAFNQSATITMTQDVPPGKMHAGLMIDAKLTTVGAAMVAARISQIFKSIKIYGDGKLVADIDQNALDLIPITLGWARHSDDYAGVEIGQLDTGRYMVRDEANDPAGASIYGCWFLPVALPVQSQIKVVFEIYSMTTVFGAGLTGGVPSLAVVHQWANKGKRKQYNLYAKQRSGVPIASYRGVEVGAFFADAEWNSITSSMKLGDVLSVEQAYALQSNVGNHMCLWAQARGSQVDDRLTTILNPLTAADVYVLANKFDGQATAEFSFLALETVQAVILSEAGPEQIEVK